MTLTHIPASTIESPERFEDEETGRGYDVFPDTDAEDPRDWVENSRAALWAYREPRTGGGSVAAHQPKGNIAIDAFAEFYERTGDDETALLLTRRYLAVFHPEKGYSVATMTIRGYSQSDWLDVVCAVADGYGTPKDHIDEFRMWAFGDVWVVVPDGKGYAMGGVYAESAEDAVAHFRENFEDDEHQPVAPASNRAAITVELDDGARAHWSDVAPEHVDRITDFIERLVGKADGIRC